MIRQKHPKCRRCKKKQGMLVGKGHILGYQTIWARAVRLQNKNHDKKVLDFQHLFIPLNIFYDI